MQYEERIAYLRNRYSYVSTAEPEINRDLVENDQFICPCCHQLTTRSEGHYKAKRMVYYDDDVPEIWRHSIRVKTYYPDKVHDDQVLFLVCDNCWSSERRLEKDPDFCKYNRIASWISVIVGVFIGILLRPRFNIFTEIFWGIIIFIIAAVLLDAILTSSIRSYFISNKYPAARKNFASLANAVSMPDLMKANALE